MPPTPKELGKPLLPPTQVTRVRFSPDGKTLLAAGYDGLVRRYDVTKPESPVEIPALPGHKGWVTALAPSGDLMISADSWGYMVSRAIISVNSHPSWDIRDAHDGWIRDASVSSDKSKIATCGKDGFVRIWTAEGKKAAEIDAKADVLSVLFAPDGKSVFAGDLFGIVRLFEIPSGKVLRSFDAKELYKLDRIQDVGGAKVLLLDTAGKTLFVGGAIPTGGGFVECTPLLLTFDAATGRRLSQWKGDNNKDGYVTDLAWHPDGFVIGTTSGQPGQGKLFFWKPGDAAPFFSNAKMQNCHSVALHPSGDRLAVSGTNANSAGNGRVKGKDGDYPANVSPIQMWRLS
jgi:WD40 repeat protein